MTSDLNFTNNKHLLWRAGFGIGLSQVADVRKLKRKDLLKELFMEDHSQIIDYSTADIEPPDYEASKASAEMRNQIQKVNQKQNQELNLNFLDEMVNSKSQLQEKMAFFWHGHFATRINNPKFNKHQLNIIRKNALGNFRELLFEVSKSPAMLNFLNNQQNKKGHPNENFAREVMELFTMGIGNYSETDIREAARAFTGWGYDKEGNFIERLKQHDDGSKTFLGKTGNFSGDDVLNIILEQKATAKFITTKIYRFFVNEKADQSTIANLSEKFYQSGYDIKQLMNEIFSSDWFYEPKNIGNRIKSPTELMVGMMRILPMTIQNPENLVVYQKLLGQTLLSPPNVSGWPSGKSWIDSSTLMLRLQIPQIWSGLRPLDLSPKEDDDVEMGMKSREALKKSFKNPNITIDWTKVETAFNKKDCEDFLLLKPENFNTKAVQNFSDKSTKINIINIMSTPEYQLM
ncbi:DUF1800 domain-containing protein [Chryseobacterium foetidum]|uniref:DUF1800 domain-containing protein n=1 Tax=Chryseobacterium foetidum TaxID=2951057 RepID=UPI0021C5C898|nr:DUF1800 domain-containing protein [Chryseobacterium foetidum]